ncbi:methyltransferase domain-containing protein [Rhodobacterales bacterium HKCCE2091]|nr:methyltransferase domain-containing protein [Rhodobacterales bacterium HKCCE2091]
MRPEDTLAIYEAEAATWTAAQRPADWQVPVFAEALAGQVGARVLDLGCGSGRPVAEWFVAHGAAVTGVDGARAMIDRFRAFLPHAEAIEADMRGLALGRRFDVILGWNSFFHLPAADQRAMIPVFAAHAAPGARLLLTTGPAEGDAWGRVGASDVWHDSLAPDSYRALFDVHGFDVTWFRPEDPDLARHSVWLARAR